MTRISRGAIHKVGNASGSRRQAHSAPVKRSDPAHREIAGLHESAGNQAVVRLLGEGKPLEPGVRADMEARFGESFADVRVHDGEAAQRNAADLGAKAYTFGNDIAFSAERYAPHEGEGRQLIAHELAHVVQQRRAGTAPVGNQQALEADAGTAADAVANAAARISVAGASAPSVMLDKDDDLDDEADRKRDSKERRGAEKNRNLERERGRATAGKDANELANERSQKKMRAIERDAASPGAKQRSPKAKEKIIREFRNASKGASGPRVVSSNRQGKVDEALRTPVKTAGTPQEGYKGIAQAPGQEFDSRYTAPDHSEYRARPDGAVEKVHVNLKSNAIHEMSPSRARSVARENTLQALENAEYLPKNEKIVIDYVHVPDKDVQRLMLEQHFCEGSPITEVKFGTTTYRNDEYKGRRAAKPKVGKRGKRGAAQDKQKAGGKKKGKAKQKSAGEETTKRAKKAAAKEGTPKEASKAPSPEPTKQAATPEPEAAKKPVLDPATEPKPAIAEPRQSRTSVEPIAAPERPGGLGSLANVPLEVANVALLIPQVIDIFRDFKKGDLESAGRKIDMLEASFVPELAPVMLSGAVISTYWGADHDKIVEDSNRAGEFAEGIAHKIPILRSIPYVPEALGGFVAANVSVAESAGLTVKGMGEGIVEGAHEMGDALRESPTFNKAADFFMDPPDVTGTVADWVWHELAAPLPMTEMLEKMRRAKKAD